MSEPRQPLYAIRYLEAIPPQVKRPKKGPRAKAAARIDSNRANKTRSKKKERKSNIRGV